MLLLQQDKNRRRLGHSAGGRHQRKGRSAPDVANGMRKRRAALGCSKGPLFQASTPCYKHSKQISSRLHREMVRTVLGL